ncbi:MAG: ABC transporter substrate-binding protein [Elusimicrobia bacterium RIFCSPHIGHO2_02_FULL_61_10]|nr:MAG: ABC transporter substrate-binding protein [Elusimicrobia bacterium RIFCSPLOWO2_02_FULL_61_11]OGS20855.1 MAG: ABC transporter substrate-binding protein [Elusimicrobia bacterium RIFCSPHIGHO2_02_FULL_61_10]
MLCAGTAGAQTMVKFATLAPEGSTWMKAMRQFTVEASSRTGGRVKFKIYAGGVSGDEKDVVRKIRLGQLQAGGFTGVGLGEIAPEARLLDTPFLFKNAKEIDHVYKALDADFRKIFESRGYVLLGWAEVGNVNIFSNIPVMKPQDLRNVKMWLWEGDPIAEAMFEALKVKPIPLSVMDVMTSLQTGMLNGVYGSPLSVIALQWFSRMKYVLSLPITNASGAAVMSKKTFDLLAKEDQKIIMELGGKHFRELTLQSRKDNEQSIAILKAKKLVFTEPAGPAVIAEFERAGQEARLSLTGKLYPKELLEKVESALKTFRAAAKK